LITDSVVVFSADGYGTTGRLEKLKFGKQKAETGKGGKLKPES